MRERPHKQDATSRTTHQQPQQRPTSLKQPTRRELTVVLFKAPGTNEYQGAAKMKWARAIEIAGNPSQTLENYSFTANHLSSIWMSRKKTHIVAQLIMKPKREIATEERTTNWQHCFWLFSRLHRVRKLLFFWQVEQIHCLRVSQYSNVFQIGQKPSKHPLMNCGPKHTEMKWYEMYGNVWKNFVRRFT